MDDQVIKKAAALRALADSQAGALASAPGKAGATVEMVRDMAYLVSQLAVLVETLAKSS